MTGTTPTVIVVMGVTGCGKTTVGRALADALGWSFADADDFHPPANVEKMRRGEPLTDADRGPWLDAIAARIRERVGGGEPGVFTCSALRKRYRRRLGLPHPRIALVHLAADEALVRERVASREDHFMPPALVRSQLETLEPPENAFRVDASAPVETIVEQVVARTSAGA